MSSRATRSFGVLVVAALSLALAGPSASNARAAAPVDTTSATSYGAVAGVELAPGAWAVDVDTFSTDGAVTTPAIEVSAAPITFAPASRNHARGATALSPGGALHLRHAPLATRALAATWARTPHPERASWRAPGHLRAGGADAEPSDGP